MRARIATALAVIVFAVGAAFGAAQAATTRPLVLARSHATFEVSHLYIERVSGTVPIVAGDATFTDAAAVPTSVVATLDPRHIDTRDGDRDDDLQGPDWFDVQHFPTWTFRSTAIAPARNGFAMLGLLTVHGVAQPVSLDVSILQTPPHARYRAIGRIDRHAFGMRVTPMDGVIGNDLNIDLDIEVQ